MSESLYEHLQEAVAYLRERVSQPPTVGLILGSGLGSFADGLQSKVIVPYAEIPHFPTSTVAGHAGQLVIGTSGGVHCVAMQGRVHHYEGHAASTLVFPLRVMVMLGAARVIVTNAAGGVRDDLEPGTLMLIRDHISFLPDNPLRGENDERLGPRFPDMTNAYSSKLAEIARQQAQAMGVNLAEGTYVAMPGPTYETPAEIRMLAAIGGDATGMSTVPEVIAANHMGAEVLGISCITNKAAGKGHAVLAHSDVTETAARIRATFEGLLERILTELGGV